MKSRKESQRLSMKKVKGIIAQCASDELLGREWQQSVVMLQPIGDVLCTRTVQLTCDWCLNHIHPMLIADGLRFVLFTSSFVLVTLHSCLTKVANG